jgi:hypothetical protein
MGMGRPPKDGFISPCRSRQIARKKLEKVLGYKLPSQFFSIISMAILLIMTFLILNH